MTKAWGVGSVHGLDKDEPCIFLFVGGERIEMTLDSAKHVLEALRLEIDHAERGYQRLEVVAAANERAAATLVRDME